MIGPITKMILRELNSKYSIGGGFAINKYGHIRATLDIDFFFIGTNEKIKEIEETILKNELKDYKITYIPEEDFSEELGTIFRYYENGYLIEFIQAKYNYQEDGIIKNIVEDGYKYFDIYYMLLLKIAGGSAKDIQDIIELIKINNIDKKYLENLIIKYNFNKRFKKEVNFILKNL